MVDDEAPGLERFEADFMFTLGGGSLRRLVVSVGGGDGDAGDDDDDDGCGERVLLVGFFAGVLLTLPPDVDGYESAVEGGAGRIRLGPFVGK